MKISNIIKAIDSIDNMQDMNNVIASLKIRRAFLKNELARKARSTFKVGDTVICNSKAGKEKAIIMDIRRSWATINIKGTKYNAPLSILEVA